MRQYPNRNEMVKDLCKPGQIGAEIGVFEGGFSEVLLSTNPQRLYLIDWWRQQEGDYEADPTNLSVSDEMYLRVVAKFASNSAVVTLRLLSQEAAIHFPDKFFDWAYIDADHTYKAAKNDLHLWCPKVKIGGLLMGHDYTTTSWIQVKQAVDEFLAGCELDYLSLEDWPSWGIIRKKKRYLIHL